MQVTIEQRLERIERMLGRLLQQGPEKGTKSKWVKARVITELTGWDNAKMRQARNGGTIKWKRENGLWYDLNSLHPLLVKSKN